MNREIKSKREREIDRERVRVRERERERGSLSHMRMHREGESYSGKTGLLSKEKILRVGKSYNC